MPVLFNLAQNQYLSIIIVYQFNVILIPTIKKVLLVINFFFLLLKLQSRFASLGNQFDSELWLNIFYESFKKTCT